MSESRIPASQYRTDKCPPENSSWAAHYALARPPLRKHIRHTLMPGAGKAEFERWVMKALPWRFFARTDQTSPHGDWMTWLLQAGRGAGKTRTGAEWSWEQVHRWPGFLHAVVSPTFDDLDKVTFDGPSGLMRLVERFPNRVRKVIRRPWRIDFMNGSRITSFTGEATERLRGPEHNCIAEGTLIETETGMVRIEDLKPGQKVQTRAGFREVQGVICTGIRDVVTVTVGGRSVECTGDHRIWSLDRKGWVSALRLNTGEKVATRTFTGRATTGRKQGISLGMSAAAGGVFTGTSTLLLSGKSPRDMKSITGLAGRLTTVQRISLACQEQSIAGSTSGGTTSEGQQRDSRQPVFNADGHSCITITRPDSAADSVSTRQGSQSLSQSSDLAQPAASPSRPIDGWKGSVQSLATPDSKGKSTSPSARHATTAETASPPPGVTPVIALAIAQSRIVRASEVVDVAPSRACPTYDIQVEGAHEFFAGGIVVSNSVWIDELAGMGKAADEVYTQASFGLRRVGPKGQQPRMLLTSTPKPLPLFRTLNARFAAGDPAVVITRASTMDNFANLSSHAIDELRGRYDGTRLGRQELLGELLMDVPGALWTADMFQRASMPPRLDRVVVGVDPSGAANPLSKSDAIGIVVVGVVFGRTKTEDRFYVLEDATLVASPNQWSARVAKAYEDWDADRVVAEGNFGGAMVESVIRSAAPNIPVKLVTATRGKVVRAEPIAALYEQGRVYHVGMFPSMEDEMMAFTVTGYTGESSPDRADAAIWGVTDLMSRIAAPSADVLGGSRPSPWRPSV